MPQAFLSHSSKDSRIVKKVGDFLSKSLMKVWLDIDELSAGASLSHKILSGIKESDYFVVFISNYFLESDWCNNEIRSVYSRFVENKVKIISVLLQPESELDFSLSKESSYIFEDLLKRTIYVEIDEYDPDPGIKAVVDSIWKQESIRFEPIRVKNIDGQEIQLIKFKLQTRKLESDFLKTWRFDIESFLAQSEENRDNKPIVDNLPVAFNGAGPIWLFTSMAVPLKNRLSIFIYNIPDDEYICTYSLPKDNMLGKVLKANR